MPVSVFLFQRFDKVIKRQGVSFRGVVLAVVPKLDGFVSTVVVEADHPDFKGIVHTYAPEQLMKVSDTIPEPPTDVPVGSMWEHHKRGDLYEVVDLSLDEPTLEWLVTYKSDKSFSMARWTRRYSVFKDRFHRVLL